MRSVFAKALHDQWRLILAWTVFSGLFAAFYLALYPSIGAVEEMQRLLDQMPPALRAMFAGGELELGTPEGYLNVELFAFVVPLMLLAVTVPLGAGTTAGEEERGTLELLLANPIPRWRVIIDKFAAMVVATTVVVTGMLLALGVTAWASDIDLALDKVAGALVSGGLLGLGYGTLAMAIGALTGSRVLSMGLALGVSVAGFFVNALGPLVDWLEPWRVLSPHYHYIGSDPLAHGLDPEHGLALLGLALVLLAVAVGAFQRRDLAR